MPRYFITGGRQRPSRLRTRQEWNAYEKAVLVELDTDTGARRTVLEYESPPGRRPVQAPSFVFKAGSWDGDQLLLCTQTEVVVFDPAAGRVVRTISHPWFNDVHHVERIGGRLHVVSTGLDLLLIFDEDDENIAEWHSATGADPWERFDPDTDYRLVTTTKPHGAHPNYVFEADGAVWVTRFEQRDALRLTTGVASPGDATSPAGLATSPRLAEDPVHDGVLHEGRVWFTVVSGEVVAVDPIGGAITARYDLRAMRAEGERPLGWCRGIHHAADHVLLAFSHLRPTAIKQNLSWLRKPLGRQQEPAPTRVDAYDLTGGRRLASWELESSGVSSIFSILPGTPPARGVG